MADLVIPREGKVPGSPIQQDGIHWYSPGPVATEFLRDDSFIVGIRGPFGSGKSVTAVMKLLSNAKKQMAYKGADGWARRRTVIIRNTYPELRTTTMNTFFAWIPKTSGHWRDAGPPMLHIRDVMNKLDWEIYFVALDRPDDIKKLLGMEMSDVWINEAREVPKAILDGLTGRVGRYPATWQGGCVCRQIIMDTNPPDTDNWWYTLAERDQSSEKKRALIQSMLTAEEELRTLGFLRKDQTLMKFYSQPSGRSPQAENIRNLPGGYYQFQTAGKDDDWIKVYVDGEYGFVMDGKPVYPEYRDSTHSAEFPALKGLGFRLGFDFGLTPAGTLSQRLANGCWLIHYEYVSERMGITSFAKELSRELKEKFPGMILTSARGDPAGDAMTPDESTCFKILQANGFPLARPAPTNDPVRRREGVRYLLRTMVDGVPAIRYHKNCVTLRKGMSGGFHYRRLQVAGEEKYRDVPEKNQFSHAVEAHEYDIVSAGEDRNVTVSEERRYGTKPAVADSEYNMFSGEHQ